MQIKIFVIALVFTFAISVQEVRARNYTPAQCYETAIGGTSGATASDCTNLGLEDLGGLYNAACQLDKRCCGPISSIGKTPVNPDTCAGGPKACNDPAIGGLCKTACTTGDTPTVGVCTTGQCCIPGGGGTCSSKGGVCMGSVSRACNSFYRVPNPTGGTCSTPGEECCSSYTVSPCPGTCRSIPATSNCPSGETEDRSSICSLASQKCCVAGLPRSVQGPQLNEYQLLEVIPGSTTAVNERGRLSYYLQDIYRFAFWAVGIATVLMLTIGGFMYLTSAGNTSRIGTAKTIIWDAFLGLILALVSWLFLNIINPDLVNLTLPKIAVTVPPVTTPPPPTSGSPAQGLANQLLAHPNIALRGTGDCRDASGSAISPRSTVTQIAAGTEATACFAGCSPTSDPCTRSTDLKEILMNNLLMLADAGFGRIDVISLTGGSHGTTSRHYSGLAVDLAIADRTKWWQVVNMLRAGGATEVGCDVGGRINPTTGRKEYIVSNDRCNEATHIHAAW